MFVPVFSPRYKFPFRIPVAKCFPNFGSLLATRRLRFRTLAPQISLEFGGFPKNYRAKFRGNLGTCPSFSKISCRVFPSLCVVSVCSYLSISYLCLALSGFLYPCVAQSVSSVCVSLSLCVCLCFSVSRVVSVCFCLFYVSVSVVRLYFFAFFCVCLCLFVYFRVSVSVYLVMFVYICFIFIFLFVCICFCRSVHKHGTLARRCVLYPPR